MELPTLQLYYTISSPGQQCCEWLVKSVPVLTEHIVKTAFNFFFALFLLLRGKYRREAFQHNDFPLKGYRLYFSLICDGLCHWKPPFQNGCTCQRFPLVLWGNVKRRHPQVPPFELSPLRADVARGQYGLEWNFCLASSTLLRSKTS